MLPEIINYIEYCPFARHGEELVYLFAEFWDDQTQTRCYRAAPVSNLPLPEVFPHADYPAYPAAELEPLSAVRPDAEALRAFYTLRLMPWELAREGRYPFLNDGETLTLTEDDLLSLLANLHKRIDSVVFGLWAQTFAWRIEEGVVVPPEGLRFGMTPAALSSCIYTLMDDYSYGELSIEGFLESCAELEACYLASRGKSLTEQKIPSRFAADMVSVMEDAALEMTEEMRTFYRALLADPALDDDEHMLHNRAYAYYGGNAYVSCDWKQSEQALLKYFAITGDAYAANSLGYIYYSDRLGAPDHEKALKYFSYAADHYITEATYKLSDMYRKGDGTPLRPRKAWLLISHLYKDLPKTDLSADKYPDIALRMGYCYRDGIGVNQNTSVALAFFLRAKEGIEQRIEENKEFGDETVLKNVLAAIESVRGETQTAADLALLFNKKKIGYFAYDFEWSPLAIVPFDWDEYTLRTYGTEPVDVRSLGVSKALYRKMEALRDEFLLAVEQGYDKYKWLVENQKRIRAAYGRLCADLAGKCEISYNVPFCFDNC